MRKSKGMSICLSVYLPVCLSVCLSVYLSVGPALRPSVRPSILTTYLPIHPPIRLPIYPPVRLPARLPACLPTWVPFCLVPLRKRHGFWPSWRISHYPIPEPWFSHLCIVSITTMIYIVVHCVWRNFKRQSSVIGIAFPVVFRKRRFGGITTAFGTYPQGNGHVAL